jgi:hypothetical protein
MNLEISSKKGAYNMPIQLYDRSQAAGRNFTVKNELLAAGVGRGPVSLENSFPPSPSYSLRSSLTTGNLQRKVDLTDRISQTDQTMLATGSSVKINGVVYVSILSVAKCTSAIVFLICLFFLIVGRVTGERLADPMVAFSFGIAALGLLCVALVAEKRP